MKNGFLLPWLLMCLATLSVSVGIGSAQPVRLVLRPKSHVVAPGQEVAVNCVLLDANNNPVKSPKDIQATVEILSPSAQPKQIPITIKTGATGSEFKIGAGENGVTEVRARSGELQGATTFIRVRPMLPVNIAPISPLSITEHSQRLTFAPHSGAGPSTNVPREKRGSGSQPLTTPATPVIMPTPIGGIILKQESRTFLADGKDAATITAFFDGDAGDSTTNILVTLSDDLGQMSPIPLVIPVDQGFAEAKITSEHVGVATVEFIKSAPKMTNELGQTLQIHFGPPIVKLGIQASPENISLLEKADISLQLLNDSGELLPTDVPRNVELSFTGGAQLASNHVVIAANTSSAHTTIYPTQTGTIVISASSDNLLTQTVTISVIRPTSLIVSSLLGGFLGGLLAAYSSKRRRKDKSARFVRIAIGMITGFVLYYFAVLGFVSAISAAIVYNPFAAVFISIIGGWLGTEVFTPICKRLLPKT